uniref:Uncharacterized protein n=1 Tax=Arundo donax TaxID=35708 RepID=A0A0A9FZI1_ARUDO
MSETGFGNTGPMHENNDAFFGLDPNKKVRSGTPAFTDRDLKFWCARLLLPMDSSILSLSFKRALPTSTWRPLTWSSPACSSLVTLTWSSPACSSLVTLLFASFILLTSPWNFAAWKGVK